MKHSDNRVLAVWGSPSCGKTTIAAKIAGYIADKGFDVALCSAIPMHRRCRCLHRRQLSKQRNLSAVYWRQQG